MADLNAVVLHDHRGEPIAAVTSYTSANGVRLVGLKVHGDAITLNAAKAHELGCLLVWACCRGLEDHPMRASDPDP